MPLQGLLVAVAMAFLALTGCIGNFPDGAERESPPVELLEVKNAHGSVEGLDRIKQFMNLAANEQGTALRVTHMTVEGDPIYYDVTYDAINLYRVRFDTSKDKFGKGEVKTYRCEKFVESETDTSVAYAAEKCLDGIERVVVLDIGYDVSAQDRFEFLLEYGENVEKTLRSGELSSRQVQETYKALVLANYLHVKELSAACEETGSNERYKLTVWINTATKRYEWASCDNSPAGKAMTAIAKKLLPDRR